MKCKHCQKETKKKKFCSRSCSASHTNKTHPRRKIKRKCKKGDSIVRNYRSSLCQKHWDEYLSNKKEKLMQTPVGEYRQRVKEKGYHASSIHVNIRRFARSWLKHLTKLPCKKCGYDKHVELCHIKPVASFDDSATIGEINDEKNVIQLCPKCHLEFDNLE